MEGIVWVQTCWFSHLVRLRVNSSNYKCWKNSKYQLPYAFLSGFLATNNQTNEKCNEIGLFEYMSKLFLLKKLKPKLESRLGSQYYACVKWAASCLWSHVSYQSFPTYYVRNHIVVFYSFRKDFSSQKNVSNVLVRNSGPNCFLELLFDEGLEVRVISVW